MGKNRLDLSALDLKLLAMAAMLVDHMGYLLFPTVMWMRYVGRLAFPIFAFQIAEGWYRTHNREKYTLRLLKESRTRQILLFTCHRREGDYLRDRAHVISLN